MTLTRSSDRKTANSATDGGNVRIRNAFGILSGSANSCPGATSVCESVCYAGRIETQYPNVMRAMSANFDIVRSLSWGDLVLALNSMIKEFSAECERFSAPKEFRIHHDGDFFSRSYASAWAMVIEANPDVQFWAYTRSFIPGHNVVDILAGIPNLSLYISVDRDNLEAAKIIRGEYPTIRWAFLADTAAETKAEMLSLFPRPGAICPENIKQIPLISKNGGACHTCGICVTGKADVRFTVKNR